MKKKYETSKILWLGKNSHVTFCTAGGKTEFTRHWYAKQLCYSSVGGNKDVNTNHIQQKKCFLIPEHPLHYFTYLNELTNSY